jgi:uncharacterized membrane protein
MQPIIESSTRGRKKVTLIVEDIDKGGGVGRWLGPLAAAAGGYMLYRVFFEEGKTGEGAIHLSKRIIIDRPVSEIYRFWRNLENLPRAMSHIESVRVSPDGRSHWTAKGPAGSKIEWDAKILVDREDEIISWRSLPGARVPNAGTVRFRDLGNGRTEVKVSLSYHPPGGQLSASVAKLLGDDPAQQVQEDLRRLKLELESPTAVRAGVVTPARP